MRISIVIVAALLAACGSSPKANFYTLGAEPAPVVGDAKASYTVAIGAVSVPEMVDRPQFVVRTGANQVSINEFERWAGPLRNEIGRAVANNLMRLMPGTNVYAYPQSASFNADCRVVLDVQVFDSTPNDAAQIEVLWTVQSAKGVVRSGRSVVREATGGAAYEALAAAHSRALTAVSREIAASVQAARESAK